LLFLKIFPNQKYYVRQKFPVTNEQIRITKMRRYRIPTINIDAIGRNFFDSIAIFIAVKADVLNDHNMLIIKQCYLLFSMTICLMI